MHGQARAAPRRPTHAALIHSEPHGLTQKLTTHQQLEELLCHPALVHALLPDELDLATQKRNRGTEFGEYVCTEAIAVCSLLPYQARTVQARVLCINLTMHMCRMPVRSTCCVCQRRREVEGQRNRCIKI